MESSCPKCQSKAIKKNGFTRHGKQNHRCLDCGRQFSLEPVSSIVDALVQNDPRLEIYVSCKVTE